VRKIFHVAKRDFVATINTKGFIIAVLIPPVIYGAIMFVFPSLIDNAPPRLRGEVAVVDPTGAVFERIARELTQESIGERRRAAANRAVSGMPRGTSEMARPQIEAVLESGLDLHPVRYGEADMAAQKDRLKREGERPRLLAVVAIESDAVTLRAGAASFGAYHLFVRANLDDRIQSEIRAAVGDAIVDARIKDAGLDPQRIDAITDIPRVRSVTVTESGESQTVAGFAQLLPMGFAILLLISVMSSAQYLLTTTIEEKSSRTIEVILSAVSPMELMAGKILAQLGTGLVILLLYASLGLATVLSMAVLGLVDFSLLFYLLIFFLITYVMMGSVMAAVGASVNELREAQSLMTPVTLLMMIPWIFWYPITRSPNSAFAVALSFLPPTNAFAMLLRLTSTSPPPMWQVWVSIVVGIAGACAALWFASRIFKIGLLMHGRPPNVATLLRWARQS
jgi:ABC-2 type transport system permease protein